MLLKQHLHRLLALFSLSLPFGSSHVIALEGDQKELGHEVAAKFDQVNSGWDDTYSLLSMQLLKDGKEVSNRRMEVRAKERGDSGDMSIMRFHEPRDVRDTAFLTHGNLGQADDQWLYLPSIRRIKRINSANRSGPFMGSQFSFEDMASFQIDKYSYRLIDEREWAGAVHYVLELIPTDKNSGYERIVYFIEKRRMTLTAADYVSKKTGKISKRLKNYEFEQFEGKFWRPRSAVMRDEIRNRSTKLSWDEYRFGNGFDEAMFTQSALRLWRD